MLNNSETREFSSKYPFVQEDGSKIINGTFNRVGLSLKNIENIRLKIENISKERIINQKYDIGTKNKPDAFKQYMKDVEKAKISEEMVQSKKVEVANQYNNSSNLNQQEKNILMEEQLKSFQIRISAIKEIIKLNDPIRYDELSKISVYWAPEVQPICYSEWVQKNYAIDANNLVSLSIYSLLMNMPLDKLVEKINNDFPKEDYNKKR